MGHAWSTGLVRTAFYFLSCYLCSIDAQSRPGGERVLVVFFFSIPGLLAFCHVQSYSVSLYITLLFPCSELKSNHHTEKARFTYPGY